MDKYRQMDEDRRMDIRTDGWTNEQVDRWTKIDGWTKEQVDRRTKIDDWTNGQVETGPTGEYRRVVQWMNGHWAASDPTD